MIYYSIKKTYLGYILLAKYDNDTYCGLYIGDSETSVIAELSLTYPGIPIKATKYYYSLISRIINNTYSSIEIETLSFGTLWQKLVWRAICNIPFGKTESYQTLANKLHRPTAARAVAKACAQNRLALLIPCHRVINSSGKLSGYRWGVHVKKQLLANELKSSSDFIKQY